MKNDAAATAKTAQLVAIAAAHLVCETINEKLRSARYDAEVYDNALVETLYAEQAKAQADLEALYQPTAPIGAFKSVRAAQIAMTKAERAMDAASQAQRVKEDARRDCADWETHAAELVLVEDAAHIARAYAFALYMAARAQEFYVKSWAFNYNPSRELAQNNVD